MAVASSTATELVHQIFDLQRVLRCVVTANIAKDADVGFALQGVMRFIGEGESRATKLASRLGVSPPVLSRHIAELEELGLVVRRPDPADGRAQLVALSEAGMEKVRDFEEQRSLNLRAYLAEWSEEDALEAGQILEKLTTSLNHSVRATAAGSHHSNHTA
jgi:DNA-binding MarR family transcriptional regulator